MEIDYFVHALLCLRAMYPFSVTSWLRTWKRNRAVGGKDKSYHRMWLGIDIVLDDIADKAGLIESAKHYGLEVIDEGDHLHMEPK